MSSIVSEKIFFQFNFIVFVKSYPENRPTTEVLLQHPFITGKEE